MQYISCSSLYYWNIETVFNEAYENYFPEILIDNNKSQCCDHNNTSQCCDCNLITCVCM